MIGFIRSNLWIFLLRKSGVVCVYIYLPRVVIWQHIHPYWKEGWQDSSCFLGLRIIECRNSSDILERGPGAIQTWNITLIAPNYLWARIGYPQLPIAGNHRLSLLVHHFSLHQNSLGSIHLKLLSGWVERMLPFAARVVDSCPSVLLHPSGGHKCLTRCRLQMFLKPQVCVEYVNRTREHQSGHQSSYWMWTSVLNCSVWRELVSHTLHPTPLCWYKQIVS